MFVARSGQCWRLAALARRVSTTAFAYEEPNQDLREVVSRQAEHQAAMPQPQSINWDGFTPGKVLLPKDLTYDIRVKSRHYAKRITPTSREARHKDPFYQLDLDPRDFCMNAPLLYQFVSEMGKIHGRDVTNLTARSQRLLGKAIRRAKQMGIMALHSRPGRLGRLQ